MLRVWCDAYLSNSGGACEYEIQDDISSTRLLYKPVMSLLAPQGVARSLNPGSDRRVSYLFCSWLAARAQVQRSKDSRMAALDGHSR